MADAQNNSLMDLTNFPDVWNSVDLQRMSILDAIAHVLVECHTPGWKVDMLSLNQYYRVKFRFRNTIHMFIDYMKIIADHKEQEQYSSRQLHIMRKIMRDITRWILERRTYCLDDSHWPINEVHIPQYRAIYASYPEWIDSSHMEADSYFVNLFEQKRLVEEAFESDRKDEGSEPSDVELYVNGHLNPPPLENDCNISYLTV